MDPEEVPQPSGPDAKASRNGEAMSPSRNQKPAQARKISPQKAMWAGFCPIELIIS